MHRIFLKTIQDSSYRNKLKVIQADNYKNKKLQRGVDADTLNYASQ